MSEIFQYIESYGHDAPVFLSRVRLFFADSQIHHYRQSYRDVLASSLGLDLSQQSRRDEFWYRMATDLATTRKTRGTWYTGQIDPPLEPTVQIASRHCVAGHDHLLPTAQDLIASVRTAVARTVTYIRLFPPAKPDEAIPDFGSIPDGLKQCWKILRRHPRFRQQSGGGDLNQHALDSICSACGADFVLAPHEIAPLKQRIEQGALARTLDPAQNPWIWPWAIFKYATQANINTGSTTTPVNPHAWIWMDSHPRYGELWSVR
jgi:hypothetical protein